MSLWETFTALVPPAVWIWTTVFMVPFAWLFARQSSMDELNTRVFNIERQLAGSMSDQDTWTLRDKVNKMDGMMVTLMATINRVEIQVGTRVDGNLNTGGGDAVFRDQDKSDNRE